MYVLTSAVRSAEIDFRSVRDPLVAGRIEVAGIFIGQPQLFAGLTCLLAFALLYLFVRWAEQAVGASGGTGAKAAAIT